MDHVPTARAIPRRGRGTAPADETVEPPVADWAQVEQALRAGDTWPFWLSVVREDGSPHVRPVFAAWAGTSFFIASKATAAKTAHLQRHPDASIGVALEALHLVVEGRASRVTDPDTLARASEAMREVFDWPTRVDGDELDADYGAPTSGGPPYRVFELVPRTAYAFPTADQVQPTRWSFPRAT